jgi:hypothetical protein
VLVPDEHPDDRYLRLVGEIAREFPRFRLVRKDRSRFQRVIHTALVIVTGGQMRSYLDGYQTTIGYTIYVTPDWYDLDPTERWATLRHERVHLRQFRRYTLPGMAVLYLLIPLPAGFAYFRARFEKQAYEESIRATAEVRGRGHVARGPFRERIIRQFTGPSYGWMWPFRQQLERWYDSVVATLPEGDVTENT